MVPSNHPPPRRHPRCRQPAVGWRRFREGGGGREGLGAAVAVELGAGVAGADGKSLDLI